LRELNKKIVQTNDYVEQKSLELKITDVINKKNLIETYGVDLIEFDYL